MSADEDRGAGEASGYVGVARHATREEGTKDGRYVPVPADVLRIAINQAEDAARAADLRVKELSAERDYLASKIGRFQNSINEAKLESARLTRHHADLSIRLPPDASPSG